ncbi:MAG TPA: hydroxyisourate hydrolase [Pseudolabrys sp.]
MPHLTTHVLDTTSGKPAAGMRVVLRRAGTSAVLADTSTNGDGRLDKPLLDGDALAPGSYEIAFHVGDYFRGQGVTLADPAFLDVVPVRFSVAAERDYHLPLLISPYGYSTYRGS